MTHADQPPDPGKRKRRRNAAQRETARKARQAERRHNHEQERMMARQHNEGRRLDGE